MRSFLSWLFFLSFVLLMGVFSSRINAATIETKADSVKLINIKIDNSTLAEELESVQKNGVTYLKWSQAEHINSGLVGQPDIPTLNRLIVIDPKHSYTSKLLVNSTATMNDVTLYPVQPDAPEGSPTPKFMLDKKAYRSNRNYGAPWVELGAIQRMGRFAVLPIKIHLAQYNPRKKELQYFKDLSIELSSKDAIATADEQFVTASQLTAIEQLTINGSAVTSDLSIPRDNGTLLVLTTEDLLPSARNFADRHRDRGVAVSYEVITPSTSSAAIKSIIQNHYKSEKLEAVLLFGDDTKVQLSRWSGTPGDSFYSMVDGDDGLADILIGRVPASNLAEAESFIQKTSAYEAGINSGASKTKRVMLVAHRESYPGKYTANLESVRTDPNLKNLEFSIQYGGRGAKNQSVIDLTEQNFSVINYRGHGSSQSWSGWGSDGSSFGTSQINALKNSDANMAVFFNIACSNGAVQSSSKSMAERLLWPQGDNPNRGAIAVLAATEPSLTAVNHKYNRHLFTHLQATASASVGLVNMLAANQLVRDAGGSVPSNNKMYILFGDPLLAFKHD